MNTEKKQIFTETIEWLTSEMKLQLSAICHCNDAHIDGGLKLVD